MPLLPTGNRVSELPRATLIIHFQAESCIQAFLTIRAFLTIKCVPPSRGRNIPATWYGHGMAPAHIIVVSSNLVQMGRFGLQSVFSARMRQRKGERLG